VLQSAKAVIAVEIKVLVKEAGERFPRDQKSISGGEFGDFLNIDSAVRIGLLSF
jgi:uncharacterized 2Fe-2S/4Fe-4S cluster protein (DUF4445 family)